MGNKLALFALGGSLVLHGLVWTMVNRPAAHPRERVVPVRLEIDRRCAAGEAHDSDAATEAVAPMRTIPPRQAPPFDTAVSAEPPPTEILAVVCDESLSTPLVATVSATAPAAVEVPPRPRSRMTPAYPRLSRLRGEEGTVDVEARVSEEGSVDAACVVRSSGFPLLDASAVSAVRGAEFTPAQSEGRCVASTVRLQLEFRLRPVIP